MSLLEADNEDQLGPEEDSDFDSEDTKELKEEPKQEEPEQKEPKQEQPKQESKEELQGNKNDVDADDYTPWVRSLNIYEIQQEMRRQISHMRNPTRKWFLEVLVKELEVKQLTGKEKINQLTHAATEEATTKATKPAWNRIIDELTDTCSGEVAIRLYNAIKDLYQAATAAATTAAATTAVATACPKCSKVRSIPEDTPDGELMPNPKHRRCLNLTYEGCAFQPPPIEPTPTPATASSSSTTPSTRTADPSMDIDLSGGPTAV
jgi:hypothetical protein